VLEHGGGDQLGRCVALDGNHVVNGCAVDKALEGFIVARLFGVAIDVDPDLTEDIAISEHADDASKVIDEQVVDAWARMVLRASRSSESANTLSV
jgi:hypothetical protein